MKSFEMLLAQTLHVTWRYRLDGESEARLVIPDGATRDEVLELLERKFPDRVVQYVKPAGAS